MVFYKKIFTIVIIHCLVIFFTVETSDENNENSGVNKYESYIGRRKAGPLKLHLSGIGKDLLPEPEKHKSKESPEQDEEKISSEENKSDAKSKEEEDSKGSLRNGDDDDDSGEDRKMTGIPIEEADPDPKDPVNVHVKNVASKESGTPDHAADKSDNGGGEDNSGGSDK